MDKMQEMLYIQHSSRRYDILWREMENIIPKGRGEYPPTATSAYNLMLEWQLEPGTIQGGSVQRKNNLAFMKYNDQGNGKRTSKIYKNITYYKCGQLGHYSGSCPFKDDEKGKLKEKGISPHNIVQGIKSATTGISSMHANHEEDESNGETEYNSESDNKDYDDSEPTPGA